MGDVEQLERGHVQLRGIAAGYGPRRVLHDLRAELPRGALTVVLGPGGSGKSTLLHALASLACAEAASPAPWARGELPAMTTYRFAQPRTGVAESLDAGSHAAARAPLDAWLDGHPGALSEPQRAALLGCELALPRCNAILASEAELLLLDEPDAGLEPLAARALGELLRALARSGATIVLVTHDLSLVHAIADHALLLIDGVKLDEGPPARLLAQPASERVRSFFTWGT